MSTFTVGFSESSSKTQEKEIRALALQAVATLLAPTLKKTSTDAAVEYTLDYVRIFETYIMEGRIPKDDGLNIDGSKTMSSKDLGELVRDNLMPVVETLPDTDAMLAGTALSEKYIAAQIKVLNIEREVVKWAAEGNHKIKNQIINSQLKKASMARNVALKKLVDSLNAAAMVQHNISAAWNQD
jgi:hypothetical protein